MAVVSVQELFEGRTGSDSFTRRRTYVRVLEVYTDSDDDNVVTVGSSLLLPRLGASYPGDLLALCVKITPTQDSNDPRRWLVNVDYDTQLDNPTTQPNDGGSTDAGSIPDNPLLRPPKWKFSFQQITQAVQTAYKYDFDTGLNVGGSVTPTNSAGFMFDPPITREVSRPLITVQVNRADINTGHLIDMQDAINSVAWKSLAPFQARCIGIEADSNWENGIFYWAMTYTFALRDDGWFLRVLDAGTWERVQIGEDGTMVPPTPIFKLQPIRSLAGEPVTEPVPLNGAGRKLPPNQPEVYKVFSVYKQRDFNTLGI